MPASSSSSRSRQKCELAAYRVPRRRTLSATVPSFGQSITAFCGNDASSNRPVTVPVKFIVPGIAFVQLVKPVQASGSDTGPASEKVTAPSGRTTPLVTKPFVGAQLSPCVNEPVKLEPVCWITSVPMQPRKKVRLSPARVNLIVHSETCCGGDVLLSAVGPAYVPPISAGFNGDGADVRPPQVERSNAARTRSAALVMALRDSAGRIAMMHFKSRSRRRIDVRRIDMSGRIGCVASATV